MYVYVYIYIYGCIYISFYFYKHIICYWHLFIITWYGLCTLIEWEKEIDRRNRSACECNLPDNLPTKNNTKLFYSTSIGLPQANVLWDGAIRLRCDTWGLIITFPYFGACNLMLMRTFSLYKIIPFTHWC